MANSNATFIPPGDFYASTLSGSSDLVGWDYNNGSLYGSISSSPYWANRSAYPLHDRDSGANLTIFPNNIASLTFDIGNGNVSTALPLISSLLQPNATRVEIFCTYPLSGQYDVLPRFMFYVLLIVAILFRRRGWLASAALATAMTYSTVAAVHLFILLATYRWKIPIGERTIDGQSPWDSRSSKEFGDMDFFGILPVITAAGIMLPPLLTWSSTYRVDRTRTVLVYWSALVMVALTCVLILWHRSWTTNEIPAFAYCTSTEPHCNWRDLSTRLTLELYDSCECIDFCSAVGPKAPLRTSAVMVPELRRKITEFVNAEDTPFDRLQKAVWVVCLIHAGIALLYSHWPPERALHKMYRIVSGRQDAEKGTPRKRWTARKVLARTVAGLFYFVALASLVFYPFLFILNAVLCELLVANVPTSEHSDAIGAWSPWVALSLVLIASLIIRSNDGWRRRLTRKRRVNGSRTATEMSSGSKTTNNKQRRGVMGWMADFASPATYRIRMFARFWRDPDEACDEFEVENQHRKSMIWDIQQLQREVERRQHALEQYRYETQESCVCSKCIGVSVAATPASGDAFAMNTLPWVADSHAREEVGFMTHLKQPIIATSPQR